MAFGILGACDTSVSELLSCFVDHLSSVGVGAVWPGSQSQSLASEVAAFLCPLASCRPGRT